MLNKIAAYTFLLLGLLANAQERKMLTGKVLQDGAGLNGVFVINTAAQAESKTNAAGSFTIVAQPGDKLIIYSPSITKREFVLNEESFKNQPLTISVNAQAYELEEVVMDRDRRIDEVSLGLVPKDQKQYTPAERKVFAATSGLLDPLINAITGRTNMLKKAVETEKKEMLLEEIDYLVTEEQIINELKIPEKYVSGFLYYAVEDAKFSEAMRSENKNLARFILNGLAQEYLKHLEEYE